MIPTSSTYWQIGLVDGSGYKVEQEEKEYIIGALVDGKKFVESIDIFGTRIGIVLAHVSDWHESTEEARVDSKIYMERIDAVIEAALKEEEKPEWEQ